MKHEAEKLKNNGISERILIEAEKYFSTIIKEKKSLGRSFDDLYYGSLYLAFRTLKTPILAKDIAKMANISVKKLTKTYRFMRWELKLNVISQNPTELIKSYSDKLNISEKTVRRAILFVDESRKKQIKIGGMPSSIAAVATFTASQIEDEQINRRDIANCFGVSEITIRNYYKNIASLLVDSLHSSKRLLT